MTAQELITHVESSLAAAKVKNLDPETLKVAGFSTKRMRNFFNALCSSPIKTYCEVGAYFGGTACAAMRDNKELTSFIFEDFSQPFGKTGVREALLANLERVRPTTGTLNFIEQNCFESDLSVITQPIEVLFYDGLHDQWAQRKAWSHFADKMAGHAVVVIDDFAWATVSGGVREGIADVADKLHVDREWVLGDGGPDSELWHNDVAVFVLSKL